MRYRRGYEYTDSTYGYSLGQKVLARPRDEEGSAIFRDADTITENPTRPASLSFFPHSCTLAMDLSRFLWSYFPLGLFRLAWAPDDDSVALVASETNGNVCSRVHSIEVHRDIIFLFYSIRFFFFTILMWHSDAATLSRFSWYTRVLTFFSNNFLFSFFFLYIYNRVHVKTSSTYIFVFTLWGIS